MARVMIYTTRHCGHCSRAKALLDNRGMTYEEIDIGSAAALEAEMIRRTGGRRTVPQIFIGDVHVGGADDLRRLAASGRLDEMYAG